MKHAFCSAHRACSISSPAARNETRVLFCPPCVLHSGSLAIQSCKQPSRVRILLSILHCVTIPTRRTLHRHAALQAARSPPCGCYCRVQGSSHSGAPANPFRLSSDVSRVICRPCCALAREVNSGACLGWGYEGGNATCDFLAEGFDVSWAEEG